MRSEVVPLFAPCLYARPAPASKRGWLGWVECAKELAWKKIKVEELRQEERENYASEGRERESLSTFVPWDCNELLAWPTKLEPSFWHNEGPVFLPFSHLGERLEDSSFSDGRVEGGEGVEAAIWPRGGKVYSSNSISRRPHARPERGGRARTRFRSPRP